MALVSIRNVGDKDFEDDFNGQHYVIPPGREVIAEEEVASAWLGWPGLRDVPGRDIWDRRDRYTRLRLRFGWHDGIGQDEADWEELRPKLEVYTMSGDRLLYILDDPEGLSGQPQPADASDVSVLRDAFDRQQEELEALRKRLDAAEKAPEVSQALERDEPRRIPVGARRGRGDNSGAASE